MKETEKEKDQTGYVAMLRKQLKNLKRWLAPEPTDPWYLTAVKSIYKAIALLVLVALSPVIMVVLLFVFFAAV
jgi:hypothetical protein